ncbi:hypothetical protein [Xanthobacter sp. KR7-225]|uniref:hypothetical protein n=1 Tax=Xanthobacter sp. KR7-225 TaxID=3156613 RepID=UPI0032B36ACE
MDILKIEGPPGFDTPAFALSQVAAATGVPVNTIRTWYGRGHFTIGMTDKENPGEGLARLVSGRTAIGIGITGALARMGVTPGRAAYAAYTFAHTGDQDKNAPEFWRLPGRLWGGSVMTVLALPAIADDLPEVRRVGPTDTFAAHFAWALPGGDHFNQGAVYLYLNELVDAVRVALGFPRDAEDWLLNAERMAAQAMLPDAGEVPKPKKSTKTAARRLEEE